MQLPNKNQKVDFGFGIFTMRELIETETQQIADCTILPSNTSHTLFTKTKRATAFNRSPRQP